MKCTWCDADEVPGLFQSIAVPTCQNLACMNATRSVIRALMVFEMRLVKQEPTDGWALTIYELVEAPSSEGEWLLW